MKVTRGTCGRTINVKSCDLTQPATCLILTYLTRFEKFFFMNLLHSFKLGNN